MRLFSRKVYIFALIIMQSWMARSCSRMARSYSSYKVNIESKFRKTEFSTRTNLIHLGCAQRYQSLCARVGKVCLWCKPVGRCYFSIRTESVTTVSAECINSLLYRSQANWPVWETAKNSKVNFSRSAGDARLGGILLRIGSSFLVLVLIKPLNSQTYQLYWPAKRRKCPECGAMCANEEQSVADRWYDIV